MYSVVDYVPPKWCESRIKSEYIPKAKVNLGLLPTPLHQCKQIPKMVSNNIEFYFKRDDLTSFDMSGNKIRKLEFLLGHALKNKHDCVLTIGGLQSNHARATAIASRQLGLEPYLVLRTDGYSAEEAASNDLNIGVPGNLLLDRMVNSQIYTVSTDDYVSIGGLNILNKLGSQLREEGRNPYIIPVGGSNMLGTWGYMQAVDELNQQLCQLSSHDIANSTEMTTYHIVFASGSGGTACGLVLGCYLAGLTLNSPYREANCRLVVKLHGICVCDAPDDFYDHINKEAHTMLEQAAGSTNPIFESREQCTFYQGMGIGYGLMTNDELLYLMQECITPSGILVDHCYSGKAMNYLLKHIDVTDTETVQTASISNNDRIKIRPDEKVIFLHTGGALGLFDRLKEVEEVLESTSCIEPSSASFRFNTVKKMEL